MVLGKKKRFMKLYEPVHARFEKYCKARVYGELEFSDLMHDTLVIAFEQFEQLKEEGAFLHFLFGISRRVLANTNRKMKPEIHRDFSQLENNYITRNTAESQSEIDDLYAAIAQLPDGQKEAIILFELSGFSINEIAELQASSVDAVKQRLVRGRKQLLTLLQENEVESIPVSHDRA